MACDKSPVGTPQGGGSGSGRGSILCHLCAWAAVIGEGSSVGEKDNEALVTISQAMPDAVMMAIADKDTWNLHRSSPHLWGRCILSVASVVPDKFLQIVGIIEQWGDVSKISVTEAIGRLRAFEESLKGRRRENEDGHLLLTRAQLESLSLKEKKNHNRGGGHGKAGGYHGGGCGRDNNCDDDASDDSDDDERKLDRKKVKCYNCGIRGHIAVDCRKPRKEQALLATADDEPCLL
uniref:CCHC-type domain-containing protein n=1 Tax=Oryza brachyantha TaxID=4533 RepID=J3NDQ7_ORYBR